LMFKFSVLIKVPSFLASILLIDCIIIYAHYSRFVFDILFNFLTSFYVSPILIQHIYTIFPSWIKILSSPSTHLMLPFFMWFSPFN
jgi:hypothetical protein